VEKKEYDRVLEDDTEQLYEFICRIYTLLTQRKLVAPPLASTVVGNTATRN
jgi:hypothetical protein